MRENVHLLPIPLPALIKQLDDVAARAVELESASACDQALVSWLREAIPMTHGHRGAIAPMVAAIDDPDYALHASCV